MLKLKNRADMAPRVGVAFLAAVTVFSPLAPIARGQENPPQPGNAVPAASPAAPAAPAATVPAPADVAKPGDKSKPAAATAPALDGAAQVAPRLANLARETARMKEILPPHFRQAAAFLKMAARLDPNQPVYPRTLYEALMMPQVRDVEGAREALAAYRKLAPHDQFAMVAYIDMMLRLKETADERMDYLRDVMDVPSVPSEVRSHAAFRASQLARERADSDLEGAMLAQALRLNPLNMDALRVRLERHSESGTPVERLGTLLQILKSNPVQPGLLYRVAHELSEAGLVADALKFYPQAVKVAGMSGVPLSREFKLAYATNLYMVGTTGQTQLFTYTGQLADQLLNLDTGDVEALLLRWYAQRAAGEELKDAAAKTQQQIVNAALNRLLVVRLGIGVTGPGATTRPVDTPDPVIVPELSEDVKRLEADPQLAQAKLPYAQALADLIWYQVYVDNKPDEAAKHLPALKALLTDKHPLVVRIEGFIFLGKGQRDEARVKLSAVADQDVLAKMGLLLIEAEDAGEDAQRKSTAMSSARQLLSENPTGLLAVVLVDGLRKLNVQLVQRKDAEALQTLVAEFPMDWLSIIDSPPSFYQLKAEMVDGRVLFPFGEPMYAKVTITNKSPFDITIGPEGVIRQDLWFDANLRGVVQQQVLGAAYERLAGPLVLKAGKHVEQVVRMDQGPLLLELGSRPQPSITFFGSVRTNPRGDGGFGPGGYGVPFNTITERGGFAMSPKNIQDLMNEVQTGSPAVRLRSLELMGVLAESIRQNSPGNAQLMQVANALVDAIDRSRNDPIPGVATWATFLTAVHAPNKRDRAMDALLRAELPERRLLGLVVANGLSADDRLKLTAAFLKAEKDPVVKSYVQAMAEVAQVELAVMNRAATRPAGNAPAPGTSGNPGTPPGTGIGTGTGQQ